jgi:hypothetical protein
MPKDITKNENNLSAKMRMERDMQVEIDNVDDLHRRIFRILECDYIHTDELATLFSALARAQGYGDTALAPSLSDLTAFYERFFSREPAFDIADARHEHLASQLHPHVSTLELISFYQSVIAQTSQGELWTPGGSARLCGTRFTMLAWPCASPLRSDKSITGSAKRSSATRRREGSFWILTPFTA